MTTHTVRIRLYPLLERAVDEGIAYGYRRAHKHVDSPSEAQLRDAMVMAVMEALCEVIDFDTEPDAST